MRFSKVRRKRALQQNTCRFFERVTMAAGIHLFPFRTEKLSPPAPMVLRGRLRGRVGRRPFLLLGALRLAARFGLRPTLVSTLGPWGPLACQHAASPGFARLGALSARFGLRPSTCQHWSGPR